MDFLTITNIGNTFQRKSQESQTQTQPIQPHVPETQTSKKTPCEDLISRVYIFHFLQYGSVSISDYVRSMAGLLMNDKSEGNGRNRSRPNWRY